MSLILLKKKQYRYTAIPRIADESVIWIYLGIMCMFTFNVDLHNVSRGKCVEFFRYDFIIFFAVSSIFEVSSIRYYVYYAYSLRNTVIFLPFNITWNEIWIKFNL